MRFNAKYMSRPGMEYWLTIWADSLNEAIKQAERYTRKGYIMVGVTSL